MRVSVVRKRNRERERERKREQLVTRVLGNASINREAVTVCDLRTIPTEVHITV